MELIEIAYVNTNLPKDWKPYSIYEIVVNQEVVGKIVLREGTKQERYYDGHIGYTILPEYRGHYYAYQATCLLLSVAKNKGFKEVIITCSPDNIASKKTIKRLPVIYLETVMIPKELQKYFDKEEKSKEIYQIVL